MSSAIRKTEPDEPIGPLPHGLAAIMRPELPSLLPEITAEICRSLPRYVRQVDDQYARILRLAVEQSLATFVEKVTAPAAATTRRDQTLRRIGRYEAYEGRDLDHFQTACQLGARVCLRRAKKVGRRYNLSPGIMLAYADSVFGYVEEVIAVAREGHAEARMELEGGRAGHRRRLLRLLLAGPAAPRARIDELAERAGWPVPERVTLVAISPHAAPAPGPLADDTLTDLAGPQPHLLLPGPFDAERRAQLLAAPADIRAAVGLTVRTEEAAESLRWARQALALVESGVIEDRPVTFCADHLVTLWLLADPALIEPLAVRQLAPLSGLTPTQRERLLDTLRAWLATRGNAVRMAELLHLHPQTVRYRLRLLDRAFGDRLTDLDHRFATEVALRALQLRERVGLPPVHPRSHPQPCGR